jgi:hypothetical protein
MRRVGAVMAAVALPLAANARSTAASGWSLQHTPNPTGAQDSLLSGVSCPAKSACTTVGAYYHGTTRMILAERWNGTNWSLQHTANPTGATDTVLSGVSCTSASACTAVGFYYNGTDKTLAERWNGTKWSLQPTPNPASARTSLLGGVSCTSASACTAVGYYYNGTTNLTLAEHWNGTKWLLQHTPNPTGATNSDLGDVSCTSASACTAVGSYYGATSKVMLAEGWNGTKWSLQPTPDPTGATDSSLNGVSCTLASACIAVGYYYSGTTDMTLAERWNGTKWSLQPTPNPTGASNSILGGVSCISASACTAVGYSPNYDATANVTLAERWNGTKWYLQPTPNPTGTTNSTLGGVSCSSAHACAAVGKYFNGTDVTLAEGWNSNA